MLAAHDTEPHGGSVPLMMSTRSQDAVALGNASAARAA